LVFKVLGVSVGNLRARAMTNTGERMEMDLIQRNPLTFSQ